MRLNTKKYAEIMQEKNLSTGDICTKTGLLESSFNWIMKMAVSPKFLRLNVLQRQQALM